MNKNNYLKKSIFVTILVCLLMLSSVVGAVFSIENSTISIDKESSTVGYSHNILGEFGTWTTCEPCRFAHRALKNLYKGGWHPFYYITFVYDDNTHAKQRMKYELGCEVTPTVFWDGGYRKDEGATSVISAMNKYNTSIIACGNRNVKDIDLSLEVEWLGAVNPHPEDGETVVSIEQIMNWTVSAMDIDAGITNNEASQYNGHLHVYVTEGNSSYWDDKYGDPYTFAFLDYAWNEDVTLTAGSSWSDSTEWDGLDHNNGLGEVYDEIVEENAMVIAAIFDEDNDDFVDETVGVRAGVDTEPKLFDVYFGDTNPPPKVISNGTGTSYVYHEDLNWTTDYYWKVDVWDSSGNPTYGDIWSFTTRGNDAPNTPTPLYPLNGSTDAPIDTNLTWYGGDPDGDDVTYDVYFGEFDPFNDPPLVQENQSGTTWNPFGELDFLTKYAWKIVAWDEYGLNISGSKWNFITEANVPPDPAHDPIPPDGETNVPGDAIISWNGSDPNSGDQLRYDVYFSINYPPTKQTSNQKENYYDPYGSNDMVLYKEYYWRIVTRDKEGEETSGPDWSFWTGVNNKPTAPEIVGPVKGAAGVEYNYTFVATDPDNHTVMYYIDWGDETNDETDYFESGEEVTLSHTWTERGEYTIKAKAKDIYGAEGPEGTLDVTMPKNKVLYNPLILRLLERFLDFFPLSRLLISFCFCFSVLPNAKKRQ